MKTKVLTIINSLLTFLLGIVGFNSCKYGSPVDLVTAEYGCPYATLEVSGTITDEESHPLQDIRVVVVHKNNPNVDSAVDTLAATAYTDEKGQYFTQNENIFPRDSLDIIVTDTSDTYAPDTVRVKIEYDRSGVSPDNNWNQGDGKVHKDFRMKKK